MQFLRRRWKTMLLLVTVSLGIVYGGHLFGLNVIARPGPEVPISHDVDIAREVAPWSEERLLAAKPVPLAVLEGEPTPPKVAWRLNLGGKTVSADPQAPVPGAAAALSEALGRPVPEIVIHQSPDANVSLSQSLDSAARPAVVDLRSDLPSAFSRYPWAGEFSKFPYIMVGKAFFHNPATNEDLVCSAAVMRERTVWTAGRCVYDPDNDVYMTDWVFIPGFRVGQAPYGQWTASAMTALAGWINDGDPRYDLGAVALNDLGGQKISAVVGSFGYIANTGWRKHWHALGYPDNAPFQGYIGARVMQCASDAWIRDTSYGSPDEPVGMGCDMEGGHVGGPWVFRFQFYPAASMNQVNGISTYRYASDPYTQYSPYFGNGAVELWNWGGTH